MPRCPCWSNMINRLGSLCSQLWAATWTSERFLLHMWHAVSCKFQRRGQHNIGFGNRPVRKRHHWNVYRHQKLKPSTPLWVWLMKRRKDIDIFILFMLLLKIAQIYKYFQWNLHCRHRLWCVRNVHINIRTDAKWRTWLNDVTIHFIFGRLLTFPACSFRTGPLTLLEASCSH